MSRRVLQPALAALAALLLVACSSNNTKSSGSNAAKGGTPSAAGAKATPNTASRGFDKAPAFTIDPTKGYVATIKTDKGDIVVLLNAQAAPLTVNNFVFLARQHFYDGLTCQRVIQGFVAQCGDPKGDGSGGPGYTIPDENSPIKHDTGAVAMAKTSAPNSAGSQFYITMAPQPSLDGKYTVFGQVTQGQEVVSALTPRDPSDPNAASVTPSKILSITISETDATPTPIPASERLAVPTATPAR
jgi:cyclophilin family peptidyl-prolyl cis-trans isomerase